MMSRVEARGGHAPPPLPPRKQDKRFNFGDENNRDSQTSKKLYRASIQLLDRGTRAVSQLAASLSTVNETGVNSGACNHYEVDLTGARYGDCKCGYARAVHSKSALLGTASTLSKSPQGMFKPTTPQQSLFKIPEATHLPTMPGGVREVRTTNATQLKGPMNGKPPLPKGPKPPSTMAAAAAARTLGKRSSVFFQSVKQSINLSSAGGGGGHKYSGCNQYDLDMTGATFGDCKCGKSRAEHSPDALKKAKTAAPVRAAPPNLLVSSTLAGGNPSTFNHTMERSFGNDAQDMIHSQPLSSSQYTGPPKWVPPKPELSSNPKDVDLSKCESRFATTHARTPAVHSNSDQVTLTHATDEKMVKCGLPQGAIEHAMVKDGVDPALLSKFLGQASATAPTDSFTPTSRSQAPPPRSLMLNQISSTRKASDNIHQQGLSFPSMSFGGSSLGAPPGSVLGPPPNFMASSESLTKSSSPYLQAEAPLSDTYAAPFSSSSLPTTATTSVPFAAGPQADVQSSSNLLNNPRQSIMRRSMIGVIARVTSSLRNSLMPLNARMSNFRPSTTATSAASNQNMTTRLAPVDEMAASEALFSKRDDFLMSPSLPSYRAPTTMKPTMSRSMTTLSSFASSPSSSSASSFAAPPSGFLQSFASSETSGGFGSSMSSSNPMFAAASSKNRTEQDSGWDD